MNSLNRRSLAISRLIAAGGVAALSLANTATSNAATLRSHNIQTPSKNIRCYVLQPAVGTGIECMAPYLKNPNPSAFELDTYLALKATGSATYGERGDFPGYTTSYRTLRYGSTWKPSGATGISCVSRTTGLRCTNRSGHGFRISKRRIYRF